MAGRVHGEGVEEASDVLRDAYRPVITRYRVTSEALTVMFGVFKPVSIERTAYRQ